MASSTDIVWTGASCAKVVLVLAPGAGAPATSPFLEKVSELLAQAGCRVARFDFEYMKERISTGKRRPPPRAESLRGEYIAALARIRRQAKGLPCFIGGKSMGGRVASLVADELFADRVINGVVCLGYPFHPPKQPEKLRTAHLAELACPALIVQGERDPFGTRAEVAGYPLSPSIEMHWVLSADHDLAPARATGSTHEAALVQAVGAMTTFFARCTA